MDIKIKVYCFRNLDSENFKVALLNNENAFDSFIDDSKPLKGFFKILLSFMLKDEFNSQEVGPILDEKNGFYAFDNNCKILNIDNHANYYQIEDNDTIHLLFNSRKFPPEIATHLIKPLIIKNKPNSIFISHGRNDDWREVQAFLEKTLNYNTIELAQQPNKGRNGILKLSQESDKCICATIIMTGDDETKEGEIRARENVIHEIGYFQGKYGLDKIILLHEKGVNIPSNIHGIVYIPFEKNLIKMAFGDLINELKEIIK